jgi:general secretion pathway protein G
MRTESGFTLIELLIVVTIIGLIAAMAVPNLINAIDKGKQSRTMNDIKAIAGAIEMYAVDNNTYPRVDSYSALVPLIQPNHIKQAPAGDGWNHGWVFMGDTTNGEDYTIISLGKDGKASVMNGGTTNDFDCDIVYSNGAFFQWPSGTQK